MTNRNCPLLPIQNFITPVIPNNPVHSIKWKSVCHSIHYRLLLIIVITKFSLVWRPDIKLTVITNNTVFIIILVSVYKFPDLNCM